MKHHSNIIKLLALFISLGWSSTILASPFDCSEQVFFSSQSSGTSVLAIDDPANVIFSYPFGMNAIGYNELDDYIYGIMKPVNHLVRLHSDGTWDDLGDLGGGINIDPVVGSFDDSGLLYVREGNEANSTVLVIDVAALTVTTDDSGGFRAKDWAYDPNNGAFYGVDANLLHSFTPGGGGSTSVLTGLLPGETNVYGSAFYAADGFVYAVNNVSRNLYRIDVATSTATYMLTYNSDQQNDATSCPLVDLPYPLVYAVDDMFCAPPSGSITFPILDNDYAINTTIDNNTFTILDAPLYGTTSYDPVTGELTYTFTVTPQDDVIHYQICGAGSPVVCDDAYIYITAGPEITLDPVGPYCQNTVPAALPNTSLEGIAGTWNPSVISTATPGVFDYEFTPELSVTCGFPITIEIEIIPEEIPTFADLGPYCEGDTPDLLPSTSPEGIAGTWIPAVVNTSTLGISTYVFSPDPILHPCAVPYEMMVEVVEVDTPTFDPLGPYCFGDTPDILTSTSNEGIDGTWTPSQINTNTLGTSTYEFNPDNTQHPCANPVTITVEILDPIQINIISQTCSADLSTYDVVFEITGGTQTYPVVLVPGFTVIYDGVSQYTVAEIPAGTAITINVEDDGTCISTIINTAEECDCPVVDPPFGQTDQTYCSGDPVPSMMVDNLLPGQTVVWYDEFFSFLSNDNPYQPGFAGIYNATIMDDITGCESDPLTFTLTELPPFTIVAESYDCEADLLTYSLTIELAGGSGVISTIDASPNTVTALGGNIFLIEGIPSGESATIQVTDDTGCTEQLVTTPHVCECPDITPPIGQNQSYCQGTDLPTLMVNDPGTDFMVNWYDFNQIFLSNDNPFQTPTSGTYLVSFTNLISNCESDLTTIVLSEIALPATIDFDDVMYCFGAIIPDVIIGVPPGFAVIWSQNAVEIDQGMIFTPSQDGTYTAQVENINTGCLSIPDTFTVTESSEIIILQTGSDCSADLTTYDLTIQVSGGQAPYTMSNVQSHQIDIIDDSTFIIRSIPSGEEVGLTVVDQAGCEVSATTTSQDCDCPMIDAPQTIEPDTICFGTSVGILSTNNAPSGYEIRWYAISLGGVSIGTGSTISNLASGTYYAELVETSSGCTSDRTLGAVVENAAISISTNNTVCDNMTDDFDLPIQIFGGSPTYQVQVIGYSISSQSTNEFTIEGLTDTTDVMVQVTDQLGCTQTNAVSPDVLPSPAADAGQDQQITCLNGQVDLQASPSGMTYEWSGPNNFQSDQEQITVVSEGTYTLQVTSPNGCTDTDTVEIEGSEVLTVSAISSSDIDCNNLCATLTATSANSQVQFSWQGPQTITDTTEEIEVCEPGNYTVQAVLGACSSEPFDLVIEDNTEIPQISLQDTTVLDCESGTSTLTATTNSSSSNYLWTAMDGTTLGMDPNLSVDTGGYYHLNVTNTATGCTNEDSIYVISSDISYISEFSSPSCDGNDGTISISDIEGFYEDYTLTVNNNLADLTDLNNLSAGFYDLQITDEAGCSVSQSFELVAPAGFVVDAGPDVEISFGESYLLSPIFSIDEGSIVNSQWETAQEILCEGCLEIEVNPESTTTYTIVATDNNGCTAEDQMIIRLKTIEDIVLPNVISPSSTNGNERFIIPDNENIERVLQYQIYDRWGNKVHTTSNFDPGEEENYWDGRLNGSHVVPGVFVYMIEVELVSGNVLQLVGDLTVVR